MPDPLLPCGGHVPFLWHGLEILYVNCDIFQAYPTTISSTASSYAYDLLFLDKDILWFRLGSVTSELIQQCIEITIAIDIFDTIAVV